MRKIIWLALALAFMAFSAANHALAQDSDSNDIEKLFESQDDEELTVPEEKPEVKLPQSVDVKDLSDLAKLAPFDDIAVIQKRFLPKTGRFELFAGPTAIINDAFFMSVGAVGRAGFYFRERWGVEATALFLNTSNRAVTQGLKKRGVLAESLITPESYYGLDVKWTPTYGKMAWRNQSITPFDLYFSFGLGSTNTTQGSGEPTLHLGTGQIFAQSKSMAWRWDFSWNFFSAEVVVTDDRPGAAPGATMKSRSLYNNLFLTIGASFFFPEATYR